MLVGLSPAQTFFSLRSGATALNLGQTSGLSEQLRPLVKRRLVAAAHRSCTSNSGPAAGRKQCQSDFSLGVELVVLEYSDEKASLWRNVMRWSLTGEGTCLGIDAGFE